MKDHEVVLHVSDAQSEHVLELASTLRSQLLVSEKKHSQGVVLAALAQLVALVIGSDPVVKPVAGDTR